MRLSEIRDLLRCAVLCGDERLDLEVDTAVASDGMSAVLASPHPGSLLVTALTHIQSVRTANVAFIPAILYVRGGRPDERTVELARGKEIVLLTTPLGMFDTCGVLRERGIRGVI